MATADITRTTSAAYVRALPTLSRAAQLIEISPGGITRGIEQLGIEPLAWGRREKHLAAADLLRLAAHLRRTPVEEVAGGLLEDVEREAPAQLSAVSADVDRFFAALPARRAAEPDEFLAELRGALPKRYADRAEAIYRRHATSSK